MQAFAKLYNYKPNLIALSLKNKKTKTIGVIIPEIVHHFFATVISGIEHVANEHGYNVIVTLSDESFDKEVINMEMLANGSIDGFIMSLSKETQHKKDFHHITEVINQGMPVVMFDRVTNDILCDKVIIDDNLAAYEAVQDLIDKGFKKIALATDRFQLNGMRKFIKKFEFPIDLLPIIKDTLLKQDLSEPYIDPSSAKRANFVSIVDRQSKWQRLRGTFGQHIRWQEEDLKTKHLRKKYADRIEN